MVVINMAHVNGNIPEFCKEAECKRKAMIRAELEFYKELSESYANELRNIRDAINKYGYWEFNDESGDIVRLTPEEKE